MTTKNAADSHSHKNALGESSPPVRTQTHINADLFKAIRGGDEPGVRKALAEGADIGAVLRNRKPLERALCNKKEWDAGVIASLLEAVNLQAGPDATGAWGACSSVCTWSLLDLLAQAGKAPALKALLSLMPDDHRNSSIETVRHILVDGISPSATCAIAPLVFETSADVHRRSTQNATWLHRTLLRSSDRYYSSTTAWHLLNGHGGRRDNPPLLAHLLSLNPDVDVQWFGLTALHLAALHNCPDSFALLLDAGADFEKVDGNGQHILNYERLSLECREMLLRKRFQRELEAQLPMPSNDVVARPRARM